MLRTVYDDNEAEPSTLHDIGQFPGSVSSFSGVAVLLILAARQLSLNHIAWYWSTFFAAKDEAAVVRTGDVSWTYALQWFLIEAFLTRCCS